MPITIPGDADNQATAPVLRGDMAIWQVILIAAAALVLGVLLARRRKER